MHEQSAQLHDRLLQEWQFRREMVKFYTTALLRLSPGDHNAQQRWSELSGKLSAARIALIHATDQLQSYDPLAPELKPGATITQSQISHLPGSDSQLSVR